MPPTTSAMIRLGSDAPSFDLPNTNPGFGGDRVSLADLKGSPVCVLFVCNHCPFVVHVADVIARLGKDAASKGVRFVAISSNNVETHPDDAPEKMTAEAEARSYEFPYLYDESQDVARSFDARCTPDVFLYDAHHKLAYRGQIDDTRPGSGSAATGEDLAKAIECVVAGEPVPEPHTPSMGCGIKWKPGNEPAA